MNTISNTVARVDPVIHVLNKRYVQNRNAWRKQYAILSALIRQAKIDVANGLPNAGPKLMYLSEAARFKMQDRIVIDHYLKWTAHKWV